MGSGHWPKDGEMRFLDFKQNDDQHVQALRKSFLSGAPFPHIVLRDVINLPPENVTAGFPDLDWTGWAQFSDSYQIGKRFCQDIEQMPEVSRQLIFDLSTPTFLRFLSRVSGIDELLPDPYLEGGGLHCTGPGGRLVPHTDFHWHPKLNLYRQINVLLFLNPNWSSEHGGELQLFQKGSSIPLVSIAPTFGTCVIFRTDHTSVHGVNPVSLAAEPRRSIALYYYTSIENGKFSGDNITYWQDHPTNELGHLRRMQLAGSKALTFAGRVFYHFGHRMNPMFREPRSRVD